MTDLPEPSLDLDPLLDAWPSGLAIIRCHDSRFGATELNPGFGCGRFHPFRQANGELVPTLYGSETIDGALAETIFHNVPVRGPERAVRRSSLKPLLLSVLVVQQDLTLVQLHGYGLGRLGVSRAQLIDSAADNYPVTARWARALHARVPEAQGLVWMSRQHDSSRAVVLFGDRVDRDLFEIAEPPLPLALGAGFEKIQSAAEAAGITILE